MVETIMDPSDKLRSLQARTWGVIYYNQKYDNRPVPKSPPVNKLTPAQIASVKGAEYACANPCPGDTATS